MKLCTVETALAPLLHSFEVLIWALLPVGFRLSLQLNETNISTLQVRIIRKQRGWNQSEFAAKCQLIGWDIGRGTVSKIEAGLRRVIDAEVYMLALSLKVDVPILYPSEAEVRKVLRN